jgi:hypothetical protein
MSSRPHARPPVRADGQELGCRCLIVFVDCSRSVLCVPPHGPPGTRVLDLVHVFSDVSANQLQRRVQVRLRPLVLAGSILGIECSPRRPIRFRILGSRFRPAAPDGGDGGGGKEYGRNRGQGLALICQRSPHLRDLARHRAQTAGAAGDAFARERMREKRARSAPRKVSCAQKP